MCVGKGGKPPARPRTLLRVRRSGNRKEGVAGKLASDGRRVNVHACMRAVHRMRTRICIVFMVCYVLYVCLNEYSEACMHTHTHTRARTHAHRHAYTHTHTHTHTHTCTQNILAHTHTQAYSHIHTNTHTLRHVIS